MWIRKTITLQERPRGVHLITHEITQALEAEINATDIGLLHLFLQHTSASLTINENADSTVREDVKTFLDRLAPEGDFYRHSDEGPDDMPAHLKAIVTGTELTLPIEKGRPCLGTWQGVYLCEHRNHGGSRRLVCTLQGEKLK